MRARAAGGKVAGRGSRRALGCGCLSLLALAIVGGQAPLMTSACRARSAVRPGMTPAEVFERTRGYFVCTLSSRPEEPGAPQLQVFGWALVEGDTRQTFNSVAELGRALEERMKQKPGAAWTASFGYITNIPRRTYFSVEFGPDARVRHVSETRAGRLD